MKEQDLVKNKLGHFAQIVMDNQDGLAFLFQSLECLHDDVFPLTSQSQQRLIKKMTSFLNQAAGDQNPLGALLKAGQSGDLLDQED